MRARHTVPLLAAVALALTGCREAQAPTWPTPTPAPTSTTTAPAPTSTPPTTTAAPTTQTTTRPAPTSSAASPTSVQPTPSAAPAPAAVPVGAREIFRGDFNPGNFSQWVTCQWRGKNSGCGTASTFGYTASVRNDGPGHETAARFEVRAGDVPPFGGGERAEVTAPEVAEVEEGDERWYEFSLKFDETYRPPTKGGYSIVMQWHAGSGSPPMHLDVHPSGNLGIWHEWDSPSIIGPVDPGRWHSYVVHAKFSRSAAVGFVEVWRDGQIAVPKRFRANMSSSSNYLKLGLYRDIEQHTQVVWHDGLRITAP